MSEIGKELSLRGEIARSEFGRTMANLILDYLRTHGKEKTKQEWHKFDLAHGVSWWDLLPEDTDDAVFDIKWDMDLGYLYGHFEPRPVEWNRKMGFTDDSYFRHNRLRTDEYRRKE